MDVKDDHYEILGLSSGEEGAKLTDKEITKAYRLKALVLHPDKNPNDPDAPAKFQRLTSSYEILKDEKARKLFDELLKVKRQQQRRQLERDAKRQRMVSDLEERERSAFAPSSSAKEREEEERISRQLKEEISRIRESHKKKGAGAATVSVPKKDAGGVGKEDVGGADLKPDKEKVLKVSWENGGEGYTAQRLRKLFSEFGDVEDVVISSKRKCSAMVVMATKDAAVASTRTMVGDLSNPLLVKPLLPAAVAVTPTAQKSDEADRLNNMVGIGYQAFEDAVLKKLAQAAQKQK